MAKDFQPAEGLEFYLGRKSLKVLRQRSDESGFGLIGVGKGRGVGDGKKDSRHTQLSLGAHHLCSRWCYARVTDEKVFPQRYPLPQLDVRPIPFSAQLHSVLVRYYYVAFFNLKECCFY